jgi:uncharacterized protein (DUF1499 family)
MKTSVLVFVLGIIIISPAVVKANPRIGLADGKLLPCPDSPNCVSSQAFKPSQVVLPLSFGGVSWPQAKERLLKTLRSLKRCRIVTVGDDYIRAEFTSAVFRFVDDVEFLADHANKVIHIRSASRVGYSDLGVNRRRVEAIRSVMESDKGP